MEFNNNMAPHASGCLTLRATHAARDSPFLICETEAPRNQAAWMNHPFSREKCLRYLAYILQQNGGRKTERRIGEGGAGRTWLTPEGFLAGLSPLLIHPLEEGDRHPSVTVACCHAAKQTAKQAGCHRRLLLIGYESWNLPLGFPRGALARLRFLMNEVSHL